jgi:DNA-directed RNA polymerase specialized sigma24 family protein
VTDAPFNAAAAAVVEKAVTGGQVSGDVYQTASKTLRRYVERLGARGADAEEIAADVLSDLFVHPPASVEHPTAFLFWKARNRVYDRARVQKRRPEVLLDTLASGFYSSEDDAIARLLDQAATAAELEDALRAANAVHDSLAADVALTWIKLARESGAAPSEREIARVIGVSHPTIGKALTRLREYILTTRRLADV